METTIYLPTCISYLGSEIKIETLEDAMKFELLMEIFKSKNYLEISEMIDRK